MVRTVTVKNYTTQDRRVFEDIEVNTWGELRQIVEAAGISTAGMYIQEGVSKVNFINDESVLPHDIPFKGGVTNDLFILMTRESKNNGFGSVTILIRSEVVDKVKEYGLEDVVKNLTGRNWTQVSTDTLAQIVRQHEKKEEEARKSNVKEEDIPDYVKGIETRLQAITSALNTLNEAVNDFLTFGAVEGKYKEEEEEEKPEYNDKGFSAEDMERMEDELLS